MAIDFCESADLYDILHTTPVNRGSQELQPFYAKWHKRLPEGVNWTAYKRGRVDATFVKFRTWHDTEIEDKSRVKMCAEREDDDD